jgi:hypothetical protein
MKSFTLLAASALVLLGGCASENPAGQQTAAADNSYTPVGTYIPRKAPSRADNVSVVDKQALENDRTVGNGTLGGK